MEKYDLEKYKLRRMEDVIGDGGTLVLQGPFTCGNPYESGNIRSLMRLHTHNNGRIKVYDLGGMDLDEALEGHVPVKKGEPWNRSKGGILYQDLHITEEFNKPEYEHSVLTLEKPTDLEKWDLGKLLDYMYGEHKDKAYIMLGLEWSEDRLKEQPVTKDDVMRLLNHTGDIEKLHNLVPRHLDLTNSILY